MNVAFIPVRGGSKSIPLKNIKMFCGKPLVYWTAKAAANCQYIDKVYIATDSQKIRDTIDALHIPKVTVVTRSAESASDTASTELAMLEFAKQYDFTNIVLIQATSPLLSSEDLNRGFQMFLEDGVDSVLSGVRQKRFYWDETEKGFVEPINYDLYKRPRRQEFSGCFVENGAFYITTRQALLATKNRISGNIKMCVMNEETFFEIDEPSDWVIMEQLKKKQLAQKKEALKKIKLVATDCDGVLTDGGMYYSENGDELKKFNTLDGHGFALLREAGIKTAIITGEITELVKRRAEKLKVDHLIMGEKDKLKVLKSLCEIYQISLEDVAYIGDDIFDLPAIEACGFSCAPENAVDIVKEKADYVTRKSGGQGCFREVVEMIKK